jgi:uncharacterized membrane protein
LELTLAESASAILRWLHVIAGVARIGSSFYFIHLTLKPGPHCQSAPRAANGRFAAAASTTWTKYVVARVQIPDSLSW